MAEKYYKLSQEVQCYSSGRLVGSTFGEIYFLVDETGNLKIFERTPIGFISRLEKISVEEFSRDTRNSTDG